MTGIFRQSKMTPMLLTCLVALFLTLDISMLGINFKITQEVSQDALTINLAGRQRMLSQRMSKAVFQIDEQHLDSELSYSLHQQYLSVYQLFKQTLTGFKSGGFVTDAEQRDVNIKPIDIEGAQLAIQRAFAIIEPLDELNQRIEQDGLSADLLRQLRAHLAMYNDSLLSLMNRITVMVEKSSREQTSMLRTVQIITFFLALLNFSFIIRLFNVINRQSKIALATLDELLQSTNAALLIFGADGGVVMSNKTAREMFEFSDVEIHKCFRDQLLTKDNGYYSAHTKSGNTIDVEVHECLLHRLGEQMTIATVVDVTHFVEKERQLSRLASRDPLTGMLNRNALNKELPARIRRAELEGGRFACFFVDLNNFKFINDIHGHECGDVVLSVFSQRVKTNLRDADLVYRYGGDEFLVLVDLGSDKSAIQSVSDKIYDACKEPFELPNSEALSLSVSVGVSVFPDDATDAETLIKLADKLMYRSKKTHHLELSESGIQLVLR